MEWSLASSNFTTWSVIPSRLMAATADNRWAECRCKHFRICQKYHQHPQRTSTQLYHQQIHQRQWLTSEMEQLFYSKIETGSQRSLSLHIIQYWQHQKECVSARNLTQGSVHILYGRLVKAGRSDHGRICVRLQTHPHHPHSQTCLQMDAGHSRDAFAHVSVNACRHISAAYMMVSYSTRWTVARKRRAAGCHISIQNVKWVNAAAETWPVHAVKR